MGGFCCPLKEVKTRLEQCLANFKTANLGEYATAVSAISDFFYPKLQEQASSPENEAATVQAPIKLDKAGGDSRNPGERA